MFLLLDIQFLLLANLFRLLQNNRGFRLKKSQKMELTYRSNYFDAHPQYSETKTLSKYSVLYKEFQETVTVQACLECVDTTSDGYSNIHITTAEI
jgi:hypothetical protein